MRDFFKGRFERIRETKQLRSHRDPLPRRRKFPQTTWMAMAIIIVAAIIYTSPRYEVADHQTIQVPPQSFHGYPFTLSTPNMIGVEIESISGQPFDFYILSTEEFDLLKHYIVNGKDPNREVQYLYRETDVDQVKLEHFTLQIGYYTIVIDNTYYETRGSDEPLVLDFKVLRKSGGIF